MTSLEAMPLCPGLRAWNLQSSPPQESIVSSPIRDDHGMTDVQSIMFGVVILAIAATMAFLGMTKMLPWVQDTMTQKSLNAVADAQRVANSVDGHFVSEARLQELGLLSQSDAEKFDGLAIKDPWDGYLQSGQDKADHFVAWMTSPTGKTFLAHDGGTGSTVSQKPKPLGIMVTHWDTSIAGCNTIQLPVQTVRSVRQYDWGDGSSGSSRNDNPTHTYTDAPGIKKVVFTGEFDTLRFGGFAPDNSAHCLISIDEWNDTGTGSMDYAFIDATNLQKVNNIPRTVTSMEMLFSGRDDIKVDVTKWDMSNVKNMRSMFSGARNFNQDISNWDTSSLESAESMFSMAESFDQEIGNWNVEKVETAYYMFAFAKSFKADLSRWFGEDSNNGAGPNLKIATNMFRDAVSFDSDLNSWDMEEVERADSMFYGAKSFQGDVSNWKLPLVDNYSNLFRGAAKFDSDIRSWDVSKGTNFDGMFSGIDGGAMAFNQDISGWNMGNAQNTSRMFYLSTSFDQDLSTWKLLKDFSDHRKTFAGTPMAFLTDKHPKWPNP